MDNNIQKEWLCVVAIGISLIAIGAIADFLFKKGEIRALHAKFRKWGEVLRNTSLKQWQTKIASTAIHFFTNLHEKSARLVEDCIDAVYLKLDIVPELLKHILIALLLFIVPVGYFFFSSLWLLGAISFPLLVLAILAIVAYLRKITSFKAPVRLIDIALSIPVLSAILSLSAMFITVYLIPSNYLNCYWYHINNGSIVPSSPFLLPIISA